MAFSACPIGGSSFLAMGNDSANGARAITPADFDADFYTANGDGSVRFYANGASPEQRCRFGDVGCILVTGADDSVLRCVVPALVVKIRVYHVELLWYPPRWRGMLPAYA